MPRSRLDKLNELDGKIPNPRKYTPKQQPAVDAPIGADFNPAIDSSIPVNITLDKGALMIRKKLAGTPFWIDVETGLVYLDEKILKALKNN
jgi:hypothetical protein